MAGREATAPRDPATIPALETTVPSRPNETFTMQMVDKSEYDAWLQRAVAAGHSVRSLHHVDTTIFAVLSKAV